MHLQLKLGHRGLEHVSKSAEGGLELNYHTRDGSAPGTIVLTKELLQFLFRFYLPEGCDKSTCCK